MIGSTDSALCANRSRNQLVAAAISTRRIGCATNAQISFFNKTKTFVHIALPFRVYIEQIEYQLSNTLEIRIHLGHRDEMKRALKRTALVTNAVDARNNRFMLSTHFSIWNSQAVPRGSGKCSTRYGNTSANGGCSLSQNETEQKRPGVVRRDARA